MAASPQFVSELERELQIPYPYYVASAVCIKPDHIPYKCYARDAGRMDQQFLPATVTDLHYRERQPIYTIEWTNGFERSGFANSFDIAIDLPLPPPPMFDPFEL